jgi:hypothetical protein
MNNEIFLKHRMKILTSDKVASGSKAAIGSAYVGTLLKNIESLGFTLSPAAISTVSLYSESQFVGFYKSLVGNLKKFVGAHRKFNPMYPNFPKQVMEASDAELYINAIMHYLGKAFGMEILPEYEKEERFPLMDEVEKLSLKVIDIGTEEEFIQVFTNLMSANTSISLDNKADLTWYFEHYKGEAQLPSAIPHKEVMSFVVGECLKHDVPFANLAKTSTDVLRIATAMSAGDISLSENTRYIKFRRSQRRLLLSMLDALNPDRATEDMVAHKGKWLRLGERLHPGEYAKKYPNAFTCFDRIRNGKVETFNSKVEAALACGDYDGAVNLLVNKPGQLARRLDHILRDIHGTKSSSEIKDTLTAKVIDGFANVASSVSTPVLLQVKAHFEGRKDGENRTVFPKGSVAKVMFIEKSTAKIPKKTCKRVVKICKDALKGQYGQLSPLGKVYIEEELKDYLVPFSQRSASKALKTIVRGSKIPLNDPNTVRFFIWWKGDYVDIDLSAGFYTEDWKMVNHISYTNLRGQYGNGYGNSDNNYACHSGDITSAPKGASEFIDVDIAKAKAAGIRYIAMCVYSYSNIPFIELKECFAGWMNREKPNSGEVFEPKTVQHKFDLTSDTKVCIPMFIDLETGKVIWSDIALTNGSVLHNIESTKGGIATMGMAMTGMNKHNLYDLFKMHAKSRGEVVDNKEDADVIFSVEDGITPFDLDKIVSEFV